MSAPSLPRKQALASRGRRTAYGVVGQLLNAATNVVTAYVASRAMAPDEFGVFVLAFAVVTILLATARGLVGSTMLVHLPGQQSGDREALVRSALGFTLMAGLGASVLMTAAGGLAPALWWFAPWITQALLQDIGRYVFLAEGRTGRALALDVVWALVQAIALVVGLVLLPAAGPGGSAGVGVVATAWGLGASAGLVAFAILHGLRPARPAAWTRATRDLAGWFTAVAVLGQCETYLVLLLAGVLLGPADVAGVRAIQLMTYQPVLVLVGALVMVLQPAVVRACDSSGALVAVWRRLTTAMTPVAVGLLGVAVLHEPLTRLLFPSYVAYAGLVIPLSVQCVFVALAVPPQAVLRGLRRGGTNFSVVLSRTVLTAVCAAAGMLLGGAWGMAWGMVLAAVAGWLHVSLHARRAIALVGTTA